MDTVNKSFADQIYESFQGETALNETTIVHTILSKAKIGLFSIEREELPEGEAITMLFIDKSVLRISFLTEHVHVEVGVQIAEEPNTTRH